MGLRSRGRGGVPDSRLVEVNRGRSPVDVCKVSMEAARVWGAFPQRKWGVGLSVSISERYGSRVDYLELAVTELVK